ncbi:hypothetical protein HDU97_004305 [Phlyctochytrium planicorne]|nr:hypothetical protein HDU97_004305 [Phlyctochytrium planicorne]
MHRIKTLIQHLKPGASLQDPKLDNQIVAVSENSTSSTRGFPADYPVFRTELNPVHFLKRTALLYPTRPAVVYQDKTQDYATFSHRVRRFASAITKSASVQKGDRIAVLVPNCPVILEAHFAVPLAGCALVCINTRLNSSEIEYILEKSKSKILFVDYELAPLVANAKKCGVVEVIVCNDRYDSTDPFETFVRKESAPEPPRFDDFPPLKDESETITINFTSGTTGRPKGVMYHYRGAYLLALGDVLEMQLTCESKYLWVVPMFHAAGWCFPWAVTAVGACHVIIRKIEYDVIWDMLIRVGVTHYCAAPTVQTQLVSHPHAQKLQNVVKTMVAAAPPSPTLLERMLQLNLSPVHVYGLTETYGPSVVSAWQDEWKQLDPVQQAQKVSRQGQGFIVSDEIRVVNPDMTDTPWDASTMGEVVMRGNIVMTGYLEDEKATAEAFRGGWFHSGDIAVRHPDGYIELRDRKKDIIISGGENISTIEVENAIVSHSDVVEVCVVASPDEKWGERPVAYLTVKPNVNHKSDSWIQELLAHVKSRIAGFKMPARVEVVEELPKTSTGKIQKFVLRELEWKRAGKMPGGKMIN